MNISSYGILIELSAPELLVLIKFLNQIKPSTYVKCNVSIYEIDDIVVAVDHFKSVFKEKVDKPGFPGGCYSSLMPIYDVVAMNSFIGYTRGKWKEWFSFHQDEVDFMSTLMDHFHKILYG